LSKRGITTPKKPAKSKLTTIDKAITTPIIGSLNQNIGIV
jgi:hypothetical protein